MKRLHKRVFFSTCVGLLGGQVLAAQSIEPELMWEIGDMDGAPHTVWVRVTDAMVLDDRVYVVDVNLAEVRYFDLEGAYLGDLGRRGQGPAEFVRPTSLSMWHDTLAVYDLGQRRWSLFSRDGTHIRTTAQDHPVGVPFLWVARPRRNRFVGWTAWRNVGGTEYPPSVVTWTDAQRVDTLTTLSTGHMRYRIDGDPQWHSYGFRKLGPGGGAVVVGDSLLVIVNGQTSEASFFVLNESGVEPHGQVDLPGSARPVSPTERQRAELSFLDVDQSGRYRIAGVRVPDSIPAWTGVHSAGHATLWLRRGHMPQWDATDEETWVKWSLTDGSFEPIRFPAGVRVVGFDREYAVALRTGEFDVQYLQLYRLSSSWGGEQTRR